MQEERIYAAIDLKSFYASCECVERNLDPLKTNLVVADDRRTQKTICLAVSPSLKSYGLKGRARLFEVISQIEKVNLVRKFKTKTKKFVGSSVNQDELNNDKNLKVDFIIARPQMAHYMKFSARIYNIYLKYFSKDDIYVYSIDEVFIDITNYLETYKMTPRQLITEVINDIYTTTKITATAGIGTNLYLAKVAMDIVAKHVKPDKNGVRIAGLDEITYRKLLWGHKPLTDFWRVGKGYTKKLEKYGIYTMGDIARVAIQNEDLLYKLFGVNAELLIDHSFGYENVTIKSIKEYKPKSNSITSGQVLHCGSDYNKTKIIVKEMAELLSLELVKKDVVTNQIVLDLGYDIENLKKGNYKEEVTEDKYGRLVPKNSHGTINIDHMTSSTKIIIKKVEELYEKIVNKKLLIKRINISANNLINEKNIKKEEVQLNFFDNIDNKEEEIKKEINENALQKAMLNIKNKYGKNSILKGINLTEEGTTKERNNLIGGHNA